MTTLHEAAPSDPLWSALQLDRVRVLHVSLNHPVIANRQGRPEPAEARIAVVQPSAGAPGQGDTDELVVDIRLLESGEARLYRVAGGNVTGLRREDVEQGALRFVESLGFVMEAMAPSRPTTAKGASGERPAAAGEADASAEEELEDLIRFMGSF